MVDSTDWINLGWMLSLSFAVLYLLWKGEKNK